MNQHIGIVRQGREAVESWSAKHPDVRLKLAGANLTGTTLPGVDLSRAELNGAQLAKAHLSDGQLPGAFMPGTDLTRPNLLSQRGLPA